MCDRMAEEVDAYFCFLCDPMISDDMKILSRDVALIFADLLSVDLRRHFSYGAAGAGNSLVMQQQLQLQHQVARPEAQQHSQEPQYRADAFDLCVRVADLCLQWRDLLPNVDDTLIAQTQIVPFVCAMASNWIDAVGARLATWAENLSAEQLTSGAAHADLIIALRSSLEYQKPLLSALSIAALTPSAFVHPAPATPGGNPIAGLVNTTVKSPATSPNNSTLATSPPKTPVSFFGSPSAPSTPVTPVSRSNSKDSTKTSILDTAALLERFAAMARKSVDSVVESVFKSFEAEFSSTAVVIDGSSKLLVLLGALDQATRDCVSLTEEMIDLAGALGGGGLNPPSRLDDLHLSLLQRTITKLSGAIAAGFDADMKRQISSAASPSDVLSANAISTGLHSILDELAKGKTSIETRKRLRSTLRRQLANLVLDTAVQEHSQVVSRDYRGFLLEILGAQTQSANSFPFH
jgi:hypothetical protein